jgi:hypothetical protein
MMATVAGVAGLYSMILHAVHHDGTGIEDVSFFLSFFLFFLQA